MGKRTLLLVDVSNLYYCVKHRFSGRKINYVALKDYLSKGCDQFRAVAYGSQGDNPAFQQALVHAGYETKFKPAKRFSANSDKEVRKADWDVGMAIDAVSLVEHFEHFIFATADGDLAPCLDYLKERGKSLTVIGVGISSDLRQKADVWEELNESMLL